MYLPPFFSQSTHSLNAVSGIFIHNWKASGIKMLGTCAIHQKFGLFSH